MSHDVARLHIRLLEAKDEAKRYRLALLRLLEILHPERDIEAIDVVTKTLGDDG